MSQRMTSPTGLPREEPPSMDGTTPRSGDGNYRPRSRLSTSLDGPKYKTVFLKKEVLDTLRLYLEPTETMLNRLLRVRILTRDERIHLSSLRWPANRNELLQILVKKSWDSAMFDLFREIVSHTQNARLTETLQLLIPRTMDQPDIDEAGDELKKQLSDLSVRAQTMVRGLLRDRDAVIAQSRSDITELQSRLQAAQDEKSLLTHDLDRLDTLATNLIIEVCVDSIHHTTEEGLAAVRREVQYTKATFEHQKSIIRQLQDIEQHLQFTNTLLNDQNYELRKEKEKVETRLLDVETRTSEEIRELKEALKQKTEEADMLQRTLSTTQTNYEASKQQSASLLAESTRNLENLTSALKDMTKSRDETMSELQTVDDSARKFISSLGISNDLAMTSMAIDHARDLVLTKRRRGSLLVPANLGTTWEKRDDLGGAGHSHVMPLIAATHHHGRQSSARRLSGLDHDLSRHQAVIPSGVSITFPSEQTPALEGHHVDFHRETAVLPTIQTSQCLTGTGSAPSYSKK